MVHDDTSCSPQEIWNNCSSIILRSLVKNQLLLKDCSNSYGIFQLAVLLIEQNNGAKRKLSSSQSNIPTVATGPLLFGAG